MKYLQKQRRSRVSKRKLLQQFKLRKGYSQTIYPKQNLSSLSSSFIRHSLRVLKLLRSLQPCSAVVMSLFASASKLDVNIGHTVNRSGGSTWSLRKIIEPYISQWFLPQANRGMAHLTRHYSTVARPWALGILRHSRVAGFPSIRATPFHARNAASVSEWSTWRWLGWHAGPERSSDPSRQTWHTATS